LEVRAEAGDGAVDVVDDAGLGRAGVLGVPGDDPFRDRLDGPGL
jgi:hypothetical protein